MTTTNRTPARARKAMLAAGIAMVVSLTGCAGPGTDYGAAIAKDLQAQVLTVTAASAESEFAAAMTALAELEVQVKDALAKGAITRERHDSILAALALVRADLEAAIAAEAPPPPQEPAGTGGDNSGNENSGNENSGKGNSGNGNDGKGNSGNNGNNGKGKGKGNGG